jgi:uncharacterized membrane protein
MCDNMSDFFEVIQKRLFGSLRSMRIFLFGIALIIIASIINFYEERTTAIVLATVGIFFMIRGYSDYSAQIKKETDE